MARLPQATDLSRRQATAATPDVRVAAIDYGPQAASGRAIAEGIGSVGRGLSVMAEANENAADYETQKKLLDFTLDSEMALEEHKRTAMQPGGSGFAGSWQDEYRQRAAEFVGKDDANIPASQRGKIGLALKQREVMFVERAKREELAERDRYEIEGLESTLGRTRSVVEADPSRRDEMLAEGQKLIDLARITPAARHRLGNHYAKEVDKTAAVSRLMRAQTAEDFDALKNDLAPDVPDKRSAVDSPSFSGNGGPASLRYNNPGAMYPGASSKKFGATHTEIIGGGHKIAVFPDAVSGAAAQFDLLSTKYAGKSVRDAIAMWSGGNSVETYLSVIQRETGINPDQKLTREMLSDPAIAIPMAKAMAVQEAGKPYPLSDEQWAAAHEWATAGVKPTGSSRVADASGAVPEGYAGPFSRLSISERKSLWSQAEAQRTKLVGEVAKQVAALEGNALSGYTMPAQRMDQLAGSVAAMKDPALAARFQSVIGLAAVTSEFQQRSPMHNAAQLQVIREDLAKRQPTPEELKMVKHLEDLTAKQTAMVEHDKLTWAFRSGTVPVKQLNFDDQASMEQRLEHVTQSTQRFGGPPQYFTKAEREGLQASLKAGGDGLLNVSGRMVQRWGVEHTTKALAEVSDKIPEAAVAGYLWANGVNTQTATDIAATLKSRQDPNYKPNIPARTQSEPDAQGVLGDAFRSYPKHQRDAILKAADAVYEARNKKPNEYDSAIYKAAVAEVIGQRTDRNGKVYGGPVSTNKGMIWGSGSDQQFILPPTWRKDLWRETLETATAEDMAAAGLSMPADRAGNHVSMVKAANGKLVQVGPGQYAVALGDPDTPGKEDWLRAAAPMTKGAKSDAAAPLNTSAPFVFDLGKLEPVLRRRMPTSFWGG